MMQKLSSAPLKRKNPLAHFKMYKTNLTNYLIPQFDTVYFVDFH